MKHNNAINMNEATMVAAVQCYFRSIFVTEEVPEVTSVKENRSEYGSFTVLLTEIAKRAKAEEVSE